MFFSTHETHGMNSFMNEKIVHKIDKIISMGFMKQRTCRIFQRNIFFFFKKKSNFNIHFIIIDVTIIKIRLQNCRIPVAICEIPSFSMIEMSLGILNNFKNNKRFLNFQGSFKGM